MKPASDIMKSRIESFINHGEEDAELASQYLDKKEQIKQQRLGPKSSIGMFSIFEYHFIFPFNKFHVQDKDSLKSIIYYRPR